MNRLVTPRILILMYGAFLMIGIVGGMTGPLIPSLRQDLTLSHSVAGLLYSAQSIGSLLVLLFSGLLVHHLGKKKLILAGGALFFIGLLVTAFGGGFAEVLWGNLLIGAGMSFFDVGVSTLCLDVFPEGKGRALGFLHAFFGGGAVLGPLIALSLAGVPSGWRWAFGLCAVGPILVCALLLTMKLPNSPTASSKLQFGVYRKPLLWLTACTLLVYCGVEWSVAAWFPSYWKEVPGTAALDPAWATSLFWLTFSIGRMIVGKWADRFGFRPFLGVSIGATLLICLIWIVLPSPVASLILVLVFGFFIAGQYPTFVALVSARFPESSGQLTSFLSVFASVGTFLWPPAVGAWADFAGIGALPWAVFLVAILLALVSTMTFVADKKLETR